MIYIYIYNDDLYIYNDTYIFIFIYIYICNGVYIYIYNDDIYIYILHYGSKYLLRKWDCGTMTGGVRSTFSKGVWIHRETQIYI